MCNRTLALFYCNWSRKNIEVEVVERIKSRLHILKDFSVAFSRPTKKETSKINYLDNSCRYTYVSSRESIRTFRKTIISWWFWSDIYIFLKRRKVKIRKTGQISLSPFYLPIDIDQSQFIANVSTASSNFWCHRFFCIEFNVWPTLLTCKLKYLPLNWIRVF